MKYFSKLILAVTVMGIIFSACNKIDNLTKVDPIPVYQLGVSPVLSGSVNTIAPIAADSNKTAVTFSWTYPKYSTDSASTKYVLQIDSAGRNFSKAVSKTITGGLSTSYLAKEINTILLGMGFAYNVQYNVDVRVLSSYANNNEQYKSNTLTLKMTPYVTPPKVVPPTSNTLFLVGSATASGWNNPVATPAQKFTRLDSVTYEGTFYLNGKGEYLMLPVNGDWAHKFSVADKSVTGLNGGGSFGYDLNDNFPGPIATGSYKIRVDFQRGLFTVTTVKQYGLLFVPGDYQGWDPGTAPSLGSPTDNGAFESYINFPVGGTFEFKFTNVPTWSGTAYGDGGGGTLSTSGGNLKVPSAGYYKVNGNTANNTWSATKTAWSMIGSFPASGWNNDVDMTYDAGNKYWTGTITTIAGDEFKFRANHDWGLNYGDIGADGSLEPGGDNLKITPGTHVIT
ncbi:MAG: SusE domain-containing protein, partial [Ferruginibacter sp.]